MTKLDEMLKRVEATLFEKNLQEIRKLKFALLFLFILQVLLLAFMINLQKRLEYKWNTSTVDRKKTYQKLNRKLGNSHIKETQLEKALADLQSKMDDHLKQVRLFAKETENFKEKNRALQLQWKLLSRKIGEVNQKVEVLKKSWQAFYQREKERKKEFSKWNRYHKSLSELQKSLSQIQRQMSLLQEQVKRDSPKKTSKKEKRNLK